MRCDPCRFALGTAMLRMPSLKLAVTESWSILPGKLKVRENSPTLRSESQYLAVSVGFLATSSGFLVVCCWAFSTTSYAESVSYSTVAW